MIYSTSTCPYCKNVVKKETNPCMKIANPFEKCPWCGGVYKNSLKKEWITFSPVQRFFYFINKGVWARGILLSLLSLLSVGKTHALISMLIFFLCLSIYMFLGWLLHKNLSEEAIKQSIERTRDCDYVELLKNSGYKIYTIKKIKYGDIGEVDLTSNKEDFTIDEKNDI